MSTQALSIAQAAEELGVSTRTIRRFIKAGKLKAELVNGTFGPEYRISEIPAELKKGTLETEKEPEPEMQSETTVEIAVPSPPVETPDNILTMLKDLQEKNMVLAAQLGAATERIRNLETQVKQIAAPVTATPAPASPSETPIKKSWWQRLVSAFRGKD
jgi:excisionase family DNA binding protein